MEWVNKQAVIKDITKYLNEVDKDNGTALNGAKAMLIVKKAEDKEGIISRPKGKWEKGMAHKYVCSRCEQGAGVKSDYCPWCGAEMKSDIPSECVNCKAMEIECIGDECEFYAEMESE